MRALVGLSVLVAAGLAGLTVLRQDSATHPGSWIEAFAAS